MIEVTLSCKFNTSVPKAILKGKIKELVRSTPTPQYELIDRNSQLSSLVLPIKQLFKVFRWKIPVGIKVVIYVIWIPLLSILIPYFLIHYLFSRKQEVSDLRFDFWGDSAYTTADALNIAKGILAIVDTPLEVSFTNANGRHSDEEDDITYRKQSLNPAAFQALEVANDNNFDNVIYRIS
ncbi:MAG: hypothetical protein OEW15_16405 [Nitrospirota bacterium]|nr:hypothetical protein [Nitrospirota bacterium]